MFQYNGTAHAKLAEQHPIHCHFCLILNILHQNWGNSVSSITLPKLLLWTLSTRTRRKKNPPRETQHCQTGLWAVVGSYKYRQTPLVSPFSCILWVSGELGFNVHLSTDSFSLLLAEAWCLVFPAFLVCQFIPSCEVILPSVNWGLLWIEHQRSLWVSLCLSRLIPAIRVLLNPF